MGWYSQGTQVFDFTENADGTVDLREAGWFTPENANTWVSHVFKAERNPRRHVHVLRRGERRHPAGLGPRGDRRLQGDPAAGAGPVRRPGAGHARVPAQPSRGRERARAPCVLDGVRRAPPSRAAAGAALRFDFSRRGTARVTVDLFRQSAGRTSSASGASSASRTGRARSRWNGRGRRVRDGFYIARFSTRTPEGGTDVRRVALVRRNGRFTVRPPFYRRPPCALVESVPSSPGRCSAAPRTGALGISVQPAAARPTWPSRSGSAARSSPASPSAATSPTGRSACGSPSRRARRQGDVRGHASRATRTGEASTQTLTARRL